MCVTGKKIKHSTRIIRKNQQLVQKPDIFNWALNDGKFVCQNRAFLLVSLSFGAIAQLGERLHGMQEVVGSNPIGSTFYLSENKKAELVNSPLQD